jgi:hypothetical protein
MGSAFRPKGYEANARTSIRTTRTNKPILISENVNMLHPSVLQLQYDEVVREANQSGTSSIGPPTRTA